MILLALALSATTTVYAATAQPADPMKTRTIEHCGVDCGKLTFTAGTDTLFHLKFKANTGANGVSLGNPAVTTSTVFRLKDKTGANKFELALKAMKAGTSSITLRDADGEVAAHYEIQVVAAP